MSHRKQSASWPQEIALQVQSFDSAWMSPEGRWGASGVNPGLRKRAYGVIDGLEKPGGAQSMGLRSHEFKNDGRNGSTVLPKTTPSGESISYRTTYLRPNTLGRSYANGRVTTGSDGSAYVSRHHGDKGGEVKRIQ